MPTARSPVTIGAKGADVSAKIQHVFVLMMENRSFDHIFGRYQGSDSGAQKLDNLINSGWLAKSLANKAGRAYPFQGAQAKDNVSPDPPHEMEDVFCHLTGAPLQRPPAGAPALAINYTAAKLPCDGAIRAYLENPDIAAVDAKSPVDPVPVIASWDAQGSPVLTALAHEYALCDRWFSSIPGPTWPNRLFVHAGHAGGLDYSPANGDCAAKFFVQGYDLGKHIFDVLGDKASIYTDSDIPLALCLKGIDFGEGSQSPIRKMDYFEDDLKAHKMDDKEYIFIEPNYGKALGTDVTNEYAGGNSQHAVASFKAGEALIARVYNALRNSDLWATSLLIVTWDEHGGFFDHCPPPRSSALVPSSNSTIQYSQHKFKFDTLGVRVPALFISPYVKQGYIDHDVHDHSVIPNFIASWFKGAPLPQGRQPKPGGVVGLSGRSGLFDWDQTPSPTRLPSVSLTWTGRIGLAAQQLGGVLSKAVAAVTPSGTVGLGPASRTVKSRALITALAVGKSAAAEVTTAKAKTQIGKDTKAALDIVNTRNQHLDYIKKNTP